MFACGKRVAGLFSIGLLLIAFVVLHGEIDALAMTSLRLSVLLTIIFGWRYVIDALTAGGWVHPMRRTIVLASRWRVLGLVVMLELFVIQQVPRLMIEIVRV